ncbi:LacI family DNA-binding transcriptional regulator [Compostimonas suwonensis]|uniref:DNA-binding LacI/PurR family transcriptional regulator n=1 Tax=Compostimonas suwonensis TaxID=1048394 RepID=A0A2M9C3C4_9MICO|nr:LacI family DNA-binding transcriptional regulator [Compostimonas suwonensis]PJJ65050.1 DNA-binding LacI/PurR family transcriptional regulator [Compostimonas suwonensis]
MKSHRVTMQDVANRANVSKTAVSLAFNDTSRLSENTLRHILDVAAELGYSQDPAARMLRTRRTNSLGLLLPQRLDVVLENPYYTQFLQGIGQTCHREGYTLLLAPPLRGSMLKSIPYAAVDGFIVSGLEYDRGEVSALRQRGIPFVLVDSEEHDDVPSVEIEDDDGMRSLVEHLLALGHRRITFLAFETGVEGGPEHWRGPVFRRMRGAMAALEQRGLSLESPGMRVVEVECTRPAGEAAFTELWRSNERPTAVVCFSDILALGVLDAARELLVSVPGDVSVTGFDDLAEARNATPSLTTVHQPIETKGRLAAEYLVEAISAGSSDRPHRQRLHTALLLRDSTGPLPVAP